jgi:hypothetical protein
VSLRAFQGVYEGNILLQSPSGQPAGTAVQLSTNVGSGTKTGALSGWKLRLSGGASVTYDAGLANLNFNAGPSGTYTPIKGSYKVK